jgi:hypothetical protein
MVSRLFLSAVVALSVSLAAGFVSAGHAKGYKLKAIYSFCSEADCTDGNNPQGLLFDPSGDVIYGTTTYGGAYGGGTVFALTRNKHGKWKHAKIYDFDCSGTCAGGWIPTTGKLIHDTVGNLYGTTQRGGVGDSGGGYELIKDRKTWHFKALYDACQVEHCADGRSSEGLTYSGASTGAPYDGVSPLYGASSTDGTLNEGVFFSLTISKGNWTKNILYMPSGVFLGPVTMNAAGNFFGIGSFAPSGGAFLFELKQNSGHWGLNTLHTFTGGADGNHPLGSLLLDAAGNPFGTTQTGGNFQFMGGGGGTVFRWDGSSFQTVYSFCSVANCTDGYFPNGGLSSNGDGNMVGTVDEGGKYGSGAVYRYNNAATNLLYSFCKKQNGSNCTDGSEPYGEVLIDGSGNVFGMTYNSASGPNGAIFELTP